MRQIIKLAFRDLERNLRRSILSALALGIGLGLLLLMAAVVQGEIRGSMDSSIKLQSGHIQLSAKSYNQDKTSLNWEDLIENPDVLAAKIASLSPVEVATPRLFGSGMVSAGNESLGVSIIGIDPSSEANAPYKDGVVSGDFITADDREGILIGQPLAEKLGLKVGETINLLVNTSNGDTDEQPFVVRGIYTTHTPGYDQSTVFLPLAKAQAITQADNHASIIFVLLKNRDQTNSVVDALKTSQYQVKTWSQMNEMLVQTEQFSQAYMFLLYLIVLAITGTVIINTLIMSVFEQTREIGILSAVGMRSRQIMGMFFAESSILAVGGIVIGLVLGGILVAYATIVGFYIGNFGVTGILLGDTIHAYLTVQDTVVLTIITFITALLAALYPALMASHMEPVTALRGGK